MKNLFITLFTLVLLITGQILHAQRLTGKIRKSFERIQTELDEIPGPRRTYLNKLAYDLARNEGKTTMPVIVFTSDGNTEFALDFVLWFKTGLVYEGAPSENIYFALGSSEWDLTAWSKQIRSFGFGSSPAGTGPSAVLNVDFGTDAWNFPSRSTSIPIKNDSGVKEIAFVSAVPETTDNEKFHYVLPESKTPQAARREAIYLCLRFKNVMDLNGVQY